MNSRAHGDPDRVEIAEKQVSTYMQRLKKAARALDQVLVERGDEDGRRRLVEGALRLAENVFRSFAEEGTVNRTKAKAG